MQNISKISQLLRLLIGILLQVCSHFLHHHLPHHLPHHVHAGVPLEPHLPHHARHLVRESSVSNLRYQSRLQRRNQVDCPVQQLLRGDVTSSVHIDNLS